MSSSAAKFRLILSMIIYGTIGLFARAIPLPTSLVANFRGAVGAIFLLLVLYLQKEKLDFKAIRANLKVLIPVGAVMGFNWMLLFEAYRYTTVAVATVLYYLAPVVVVLVSPVILKEKLTLRRSIFVLIALVGMVFTSGIIQSGSGGSWNARGVVLALGAAVMYACIVLLTKFTRDIRSYDITIVELAISAVVLLPYNLLTVDFSAISIDGTGILMLAILCIVHTGIAYWLYFGSLPHLPAQTSALLSYIDPVVAILLSALLLHEPMDALCAIGAVLVLGSTVLSEMLPHKKKS
jgi:RarD protein